MMPLTLFRLQLMDTFASFSKTAVRFCVTLLLAIPFIFVDMPGGAKASGLVMVVLFTCFFGSAIAHARLCEDGRFSRLLLLSVPRAILWLDLILASVAGRMITSAVLLAGFIVINSSVITVTTVIYIAGLLCAAIFLLVALATLIGHACRSNGQVHLFGALACAVIAFVSGVIPSVPKLRPLTSVMAWNPLSGLLTGLSDMVSGTATVSTAQLIAALAILGLTVVLILWRWCISEHYN